MGSWYFSVASVLALRFAFDFAFASRGWHRLLFAAGGLRECVTRMHGWLDAAEAPSRLLGRSWRTDTEREAAR